MFDERTYNQSPPDEAELPGLMSDVYYEHTMCTISADRIERIGPLLHEAMIVGDDELAGHLQLLYNERVELFLLHLRNLVDFYASAPIKDDVVASHYASTWTSERGGEPLKWLIALLPSINKRLAHITAYRQRVDKTDDAQLVTETRSNLIRVFDAWWALLSDEKKAWFRLGEDRA